MGYPKALTRDEFDAISFFVVELLPAAFILLLTRKKNAPDDDEDSVDGTPQAPSPAMKYFPRVGAQHGYPAYARNHQGYGDDYDQRNASLLASPPYS